ncbi:MAG: hypothetical protein IKL87_02730, partial [Oscillospiraceae bacterium]|nr:hypothetical protein [Oscillospiraceae bacterium]
MERGILKTVFLRHFRNQNESSRFRTSAEEHSGKIAARLSEIEKRNFAELLLLSRLSEKWCLFSAAEAKNRRFHW